MIVTFNLSYVVLLLNSSRIRSIFVPFVHVGLSKNRRDDGTTTGQDRASLPQLAAISSRRGGRRDSNYCQLMKPGFSIVPRYRPLLSIAGGVAKPTGDSPRVAGPALLRRARCSWRSRL